MTTAEVSRTSKKTTKISSASKSKKNLFGHFVSLNNNTTETTRNSNISAEKKNALILPVRILHQALDFIIVEIVKMLFIICAQKRMN